MKSASSHCSLSDFLSVFDEALRRRGHNLREPNFSKQITTSQVDLSSHSPRAHLTPDALRVRELCKVPGFVKGAACLEMSLYLNSVLSQISPELTRIGHELLPRPNCRREINLLTFNIWGLPGLWGHGAKDDWRFAVIAKHLEEQAYDIVALQEVWCKEARVIVDTSTYPYRAVEGSTPSLFGNSGLATLSRYPIVASEFLKFHRPCGIEALVAKGALFTRIELAVGEFIDLYNVHLISEPERFNRLLLSNRIADETRSRQLSQLAEWIEHRQEKHIPVFVMGDLNIDERHPLYNKLIQTCGRDLFRNRMGNVNSESNDSEALGMTFDPSSNPYARSPHNRPERIDYILGKYSDNWRFAKSARRVFTEKHLSDHYAVLVSLINVD